MERRALMTFFSFPDSDMTAMGSVEEKPTMVGPITIDKLSTSILFDWEFCATAWRWTTLNWTNKNVNSNHHKKPDILKLDTFKNRNLMSGFWIAAGHMTRPTFQKTDVFVCFFRLCIKIYTAKIGRYDISLLNCSSWPCSLLDPVNHQIVLLLQFWEMAMALNWTVMNSLAMNDQSTHKLCK